MCYGATPSLTTNTPLPPLLEVTPTLCVRAFLKLFSIAGAVFSWSLPFPLKITLLGTVGLLMALCSAIQTQKLEDVRIQVSAEEVKLGQGSSSRALFYYDCAPKLQRQAGVRSLLLADEGASSPGVSVLRSLRVDHMRTSELSPRKNSVQLPISSCRRFTVGAINFLGLAAAALPYSSALLLLYADTPYKLYSLGAIVMSLVILRNIGSESATLKMRLLNEQTTLLEKAPLAFNIGAEFYPRMEGLISAGTGARWANQLLMSVLPEAASGVIVAPLFLAWYFAVSKTYLGYEAKKMKLLAEGYGPVQSRNNEPEPGVESQYSSVRHFRRHFMTHLEKLESILFAGTPFIRQNKAFFGAMVVSAYLVRQAFIGSKVATALAHDGINNQQANAILKYGFPVVTGAGGAFAGAAAFASKYRTIPETDTVNQEALVFVWMKTGWRWCTENRSETGVEVVQSNPYNAAPVSP
jgi:hypothetical protein